MENGATDRRVIYSKKLLKEALLTLMRQGKSIDEISISELCRTADINRNTFYKHYSIPHDVLQEILEEMADEFEAVLQGGDLQDMLLNVSRMAAEKPDYFFLFVGGKQSGDFLAREFKLIFDKMLEFQGKTSLLQNEVLLRYQYDFLVGGCQEIMGRWMDSGMKESPEYMADLLLKLIASVLRPDEQENA